MQLIFFFFFALFSSIMAKLEMPWVTRSQCSAGRENEKNVVMAEWLLIPRLVRTETNPQSTAKN
ncbi:MAG: hypothetical protein HY789_16075 [Deltaproteobacteria bacterium]|nr:hypothetical protein [Deltaproteobacteria bacterium]